MVWLVSSIDLSSDWLHPNWMVHRCDSEALQRMHRPDRFGLWSQSHVSECTVRSLSRYFSWKSMANPNWCRPIEMLVRAKWICRRTMRCPWPDKSAKSTQFWMWTAFCWRSPNTDAATTFFVPNRNKFRCLNSLTHSVSSGHLIYCLDTTFGGGTRTLSHSAFKVFRCKTCVSSALLKLQSQSGWLLNGATIYLSLRCQLSTRSRTSVCVCMRTKCTNHRRAINETNGNTEMQRKFITWEISRSTDCS